MDNEVTTEEDAPPSATLVQETAPTSPSLVETSSVTPAPVNTAAPKPSLFRTVYRDLTDDEKALIAEIKVTAERLEALIQKAAQGSGVSRYTALALTHLEQSIMWIVKHISG